MAQYKFESRNEYGQWTDTAVGQRDSSNYLDSREAAEAQLPELARVLECDVADLRVVEVDRLTTLVRDAAKLTPAEVLAISVRAGIHNPDGTLTDRYRATDTKTREIKAWYTDANDVEHGLTVTARAMGREVELSELPDMPTDEAERLRERVEEAYWAAEHRDYACHC
jgi:hypothetical protein